MDHCESIRLPPPPQEDKEDADDRRLWVGNLDPKLLEFTLLKLLQKFGELEKFDYMYHKSGPNKGKPRGYCFATYKKKEDAERALKKLNGKLALSKRLVVRPANLQQWDESAGISKPTEQGKTGSSGNKHSSNSRQSEISAIEAKLRLMERQSDDFTINFKPASQGSAGQGQSSIGQGRTNHQGRHHSKPYDKHKR